MTVQSYPTERIAPNPLQPRKHFDEKSLAELAADIEAHGLIQPIVITPVDDGYMPEYMIIVGERRWRAHKLAGIDKIPAIVLEGLSEQEVFELSTAENYSREDMLPLEESAAFARLHTEFGKTYTDIASAFGISTSLVRDRVRLLNLDIEIQALVNGRQLPLTTAVELAKLTTGRQHQAVKAINEANLTVHESILLIGKMYEEQAQGTMFDLGAFFQEKAREAAVKLLAMAKSTGQQIRDALDSTLEQLSLGELEETRKAIEAMIADRAALAPAGADEEAEPKPEPDQRPTLAEYREQEADKDEHYRLLKGTIIDITPRMRMRVVPWPTNNKLLAEVGRIEADKHGVVVAERLIEGTWLPLFTLTGLETIEDLANPELAGRTDYLLDLDFGYQDPLEANRWSKAAFTLQVNYRTFQAAEIIPLLMDSEAGQIHYREEEQA